MTGKKNILANAMAKSGLSPAITRLRAGSRNTLTILAYHRVLPSWSERDFPYDLDLISASTAEFAWQMEYVKKHFTVVSFADVLGHLDGRAVLPRHPLLVTFDDGFDDNHRHAFPVLKRLGMPAVIFIATSYIGQAQTFWYDWLYGIALAAMRSGQSVVIGTREFAFKPTREQPTRPDVGELFHFVKGMRDTELRAALAVLNADTRFATAAAPRPESQPMKWENVREMAGNGIEFGSHAASHPILTNLDDAALAMELASSKHAIERELGRAVEVIAYPDGGEMAFDERVIDASRHAGYRLGASYLSGVNDLRRLDRFRLKRLHVERYLTRADFMGMLALPEFLA